MRKAALLVVAFGLAVVLGGLWNELGLIRWAGLGLINGLIIGAVFLAPRKPPPAAG